MGIRFPWEKMIGRDKGRTDLALARGNCRRTTSVSFCATIICNSITKLRERDRFPALPSLPQQRHFPAMSSRIQRRSGIKHVTSASLQKLKTPSAAFAAGLIDASRWSIRLSIFSVRPCAEKQSEPAPSPPRVKEFIDGSESFTGAKTG